MADSIRVRLGAFVLDGPRHELLRGNEPVHLSPKAFRLLEVLAAKAPEAVSKADLFGVIWPDVFVEEANLKNLVSEVRRALNDQARPPRYLKTVHGFGYALRLDAAAAGTRYRVVHLARELQLFPGENVLGREGDVAVVIPHKSVSRRHARIRVSGDIAILEDLGSKNGTCLNGRRIESPVELSDGDEIRLGSAPLIFRSKPAKSTETNVSDVSE